MSCVPDGGKRSRNRAQRAELMSKPRMLIEVDGYTVAAKGGRLTGQLDSDLAKLANMNVKLRKIEVDEEIAALLEARAAGRGMTLSALLADLANNQEILPADLAEMRSKGEGPWSPEVLAEDARRLAEFERTREGVPWDEVKNWLRSWGTPDELPAPKPRRL